MTTADTRAFSIKQFAKLGLLGVFVLESMAMVIIVSDGDSQNQNYLDNEPDLLILFNIKKNVYKGFGVNSADVFG